MPYAVVDIEGVIRRMTDDPAEAERTLIAYAGTAPGREFEVGIFELDDLGTLLNAQDVLSLPDAAG